MSPELIAHFKDPRHVGELPPPAVQVEVENPICGDILRLSVTVKEGRIAEALYKVRGCAASIGAGSALTELLIGSPVEDLSSITGPRIELAVGGLSNESKHAAVLCADAVQALVRRVNNF